MAGNMAWPNVEKVVKLPKLTNSGQDRDPPSVEKCSKSDDKQNDTPLRGKQKFSQAAFKVIQQIYNKDKIAEVDEEAENEIIELPQNSENVALKNRRPEKAKSKWKGLTDLSKRSDSSVGNHKPKMRTPTPTRKKPNIASVMRLASLNKSINGRAKKPKPSVSKEPKKEDEEEADEADLPRTPRFCSGLSREAQFATLKCYEDMLLDGIENDCRTVEECPPFLLRVRSPVQPLQAIHVEERPVSRKTKRKKRFKTHSFWRERKYLYKQFS